jgi:hypothetical protein
MIRRGRRAPGSFHRLDDEFEALAALEGMRQGGDDADDLHITPLPLAGN